TTPTITTLFPYTTLFRSISIVANSEDQAKTSFEEVYNVIDENERLQRSFHYTKLRITNRKTKSFLRFRTSNPESKDGGREGMVRSEEHTSELQSRFDIVC